MTEQAQKPKNLLFVVHSIPAAALGLKLAEMAVLRSLVAHLNSKRNGTEVWPSNALLSELTGAHPDTIVKAKLSLHEKQLIKIRRDTGKSDMCTINVDLIRRLAVTPRKNRGGKKSDSPEKAGGYPPEKPGDTPPKNRDRTAKGTAKGNNQPDLPSFGCSSTLKVTDGDHQRKLALLGVVAGVTDKLRIPDQEQPTKKKNDEASGLSAGVRAVSERPG